jgi:hypothetical protein
MLLLSDHKDLFASPPNTRSSRPAGIVAILKDRFNPNVISIYRSHPAGG